MPILRPRQPCVATRRGALRPTLAALAFGAVALLTGTATTASLDEAGAAAATAITAYPDGTSPPSDDTLQLVGEARLRVLFWSVYDSRLYTPSGGYAQGLRPLRLEIEYLLDVKAKALVDRTRQEWQAMRREHPRQEDWLSRLERLWPDIESGDVLTLEIDKDDVATFRHNGSVIGRIDDPDFGQQFADIWLSEDSTRPELRQALLGSISAN